MGNEKILYIVHCIDTEGPLTETLEATFERLYSIFNIKMDPTKENLELLQNKQIKLGGQEEAISKCFSPELLKYNSSWNDIDEMLNEIMSNDFRKKLIDDFNGGWIYSWHCMDHVGYSINPRHKDLGYGKVFNFYKNKIKELGCINDEINWHFHPLSLLKNPLQAATSYANNYELLHNIICRRIIDNGWFPSVNRPGFHSERPDSHLFLEQWIPFDYANQFCEEDVDQPDLSLGRFGDWRRAPKSWRGYHPAHNDYQSEGSCNRKIFRCLNVGTRFRSLQNSHIHEAFSEAEECGSAIMAFANHDYRDMRPDILSVMKMVGDIRKDYPNVKIKYAGAEEAARAISNHDETDDIELSIEVIKNKIITEVKSGNIFGSQPFLALKSKDGNYYHDNFDVIENNKKWAYVLDDHTISINELDCIGIGSAGKHGKYSVKTKKL